MGVFALSVVVGLAIGVISGLLGIGGGTMMVPVFRLVFGLSAVGSTATSLFTIIPTSISGAVTHIREKTCMPQLGLAMGLGGACTSSIGVMFAQMSPGWAVMLGTAIAIAYSASTMLRKALKMPKPSEVARRGQDECSSSSGLPTAAEIEAGHLADADAHAGTSTNGLRVKPMGDADLPPSNPVPRASTSLSKKRIVEGVLIGMFGGTVSGYVGLGGGFLMIPLMTSLLDMPMKQASGTSLIAVLLLALPATVAQCFYGNVDYAIGVAMACGSIPGAYLGAKLVSRVPERMLRFAFAGLLGVAAVLLVVKELGALG